jgi:hypothetical protein
VWLRGPVVCPDWGIGSASRRAVLDGSGTRGLPAVEAKAPTLPESPKLATQERAVLHPPAQTLAESAPLPFHALPVKRAILEGPVSVAVRVNWFMKGHLQRGVRWMGRL